MSDAATAQPESATQDSTESTDAAYPPRVCRICLESVLPTFQPSEFLQRPRVVYESEESGRLLRPCRCKGSSRYVHENCLQIWRHADPRYGARNYWQCPTCGFQYRLQRLTWARWISSAGTQLLLTIAILLFTVFILGFVADPILDLYLGPLDDVYAELEDELTEEASWIAHLVKGLASLGLLSFVRSLWVFSPFWGPRSGIMAGRTTGRDRARSLNWLVIVVGVGTFLWAVYKGVRSWSRRTLEKAGERVMDVPLPEDEDMKTE
ncbi:Zinc finger RING-CH-type [Penicillium cinerascens]|uniref:Zinc finger RING-CH-type n=1 Tax=Penicillium cinerascens TaxID=70096 RepID=A0A9W9TBM4_9EURO|nr:Zinc finger RING-CH-type [Penicillium cinerascens]KAJ5216591.1 Zinc finger RING-CH-type [Penicillium cinerascens]